MQAAQNEQSPIPWGAVRLIRDWELLVAEDAARCVLSPHEAGHWASQAARDYTERYDPSHGTGLIPESAPLVVKLEERGLVTRERGVPRSVRVAIPQEEVPALEDVGGPPW
jgi:hypothetical protein